MNEYEQELIKNASKLDVLIDACGEITKLATMIVENNNKLDTVAFLKKIAVIANDPKCDTNIKKVLLNINSDLIKFHGYLTIQSIFELIKEADDDTRTLQELLDELNALIGLEKVKNKVQDLIAYQKIQKMRKEKNLYSAKNTLHLAFIGNPGTGKTTVARIVGKIYKRIGLLSKGHFIEVSRTDLIAGYQGQTALKVKKVIEQAKGGVLFIDEAYSITENDHSDSYGRECLTELTKALEDYRDDMVVIVAGYTEPMEKFFKSNPGLKSRFNTFIEFDNYNSNELEQILVSICKKNDYILEQNLREKIHFFFEQQIGLKDEYFANGRLVRNLYNDLVFNHARRVANTIDPDIIELSTIKMEDFTFTI